MSDDANSLIREQEQLASQRSTFESWWQELAYRVLPAQATFQMEGVEPGTRRTDRLYDGRPVTANEQFASIYDSLSTPRSQQWHDLEPEDESLAEDYATTVYLERLTKLLFARRYNVAANFAAQKFQGYLSVGCFGNSVLFTDENSKKNGNRYRNIPLKEAFIAENHQGMVDTLYRKYELEARQALQEFGKDLPEKIRKAADSNPFQKFWFVSCVRPNPERIASRRDFRGMEFASYDLALEGKTMLRTGGYPVWPYAIGRGSVAPGEIYGRSPAMAAWPAIMTLNDEKRTILKAGQKEVDPPVLLSEDGALEAFNVRPGALNHGLVSDEGRPLALPFKTGANIPLGLELMELERQHIDESFLVALWRLVATENVKTAAQVYEIANLKAISIGPIVGRQESEDLGPLIHREIQLAAQDTRNAWINDEMPDALRQNGGAYKIRYKSPIARLMRSEDGIAITRTFEALTAAATVDPNAAMVIDIPASLRELAQINGVPAKLVRDKGVFEKMVSDKADADRAASMAAMAPDASQAALNIAKAGELRGTA